jgi:hypothetical protein
MDKLRHIQSKIGTETAFRIPVSVEDAIAEAVEAYDALSARISELYSFTDELMAHTHDRPSTDAEWDELQDRTPAASLLLHDAGIIEALAHTKSEAENHSGYMIFPPATRGLILRKSTEIRKQADALEGEGDD